jgi:hypothetical protein
VAAIARVSSLVTTEAAHLRGLCVFGTNSGGRVVRWLDGRVLILAVLMLCLVRGASGEDASPQKVGDGV